MSQTKLRRWTISTLLAAAVAVPVTGDVAAQQAMDAPPEADETLIYVIRRGRFVGGGTGFWIAVNDETVARLRNKKHAVVRAEAGLITLNLAQRGFVVSQIVLDDRPGETVYLLFDIKGAKLEELSADEGREWVADTERMDDLEAPRPNNEYPYVLLNPGKLGFDLMQPASETLEPDGRSAVITFFRRDEKDDLDIGVWSADGFLGDLMAEESFEIRVAPGTHYFLAGNTGSSMMRADVGAGKRYYAWVDVGAMFANVKLVPVERSERSLEDWIDDAAPLTLNEQALTPRISERAELAMEFVNQGIEKAKTGAVTARVLGAEHAF